MSKEEVAIQGQVVKNVLFVAEDYDVDCSGLFE
jgi:hypothetical protein